MINKRGQFYLIAAIIIIAVIIGFVAVSNYLEKDESTKVYDLGEELKIESAQVLDYGIYNELDEVDMAGLLVGFIEEYSKYGEINKLYFIFGNTEKIIFLGYQELEGEVTIETGSGISDLLHLYGRTPLNETYVSPGSKVIVKINGVEYAFDLKPGENFYFILVITSEGEQHVITN